MARDSTERSPRGGLEVTYRTVLIRDTSQSVTDQQGGGGGGQGTADTQPGSR